MGRTFNFLEASKYYLDQFITQKNGIFWGGGRDDEAASRTTNSSETEWHIWVVVEM